jgi:hypothetical protein
MALTSEQLQELVKIVKRHTNVLAVQFLGLDAIDDVVLADLILLGIIDPSKIVPVALNSFHLGRLHGVLTEGQYNSMNYQQLTELAKRYPMTPVEQESWKQVQDTTMVHLVGLQDAITTGVLRNVDPATDISVVQGMLRYRVREGVVERMSTKDVATRMGKDVGEWGRNWDRVAQTALWDVHNRGRVAAIEAGTGEYFSEHAGEEAKAFVQPRSTACKQCNEAYTANGTPIVRTLREWKAFGSNVGVPKRQRQPVIPPHHPWCDCYIQYLPPGMGLNSKGQMTMTDPAAMFAHLGPKPVQKSMDMGYNDLLRVVSDFTPLTGA